MNELRELRCDDCAFTAETQANKSEITVMLATMCAEIPEPFNCHRREGLCAGWAELANTLNANGYHANQPEWKRALKMELCEVIRRGQEADKAGKPFDATEQIRAALAKLDDTLGERAVR